MSNDEYIALLQQQNQMKRQREQQSSDRQKKQEQREQGFNVYFGGANQERLKDQQHRQVMAGGGAQGQTASQKSLPGSATRSGSKGAQAAAQRRQWRTDDVSPMREEPQKYHNPFELSASSDPFAGQQQQQMSKPPAPQPRKQWGAAPQDPPVVQAQEVKNYFNEAEDFKLDDSDSNDQDKDDPNKDLKTVKEFDEESYSSDGFEDVNNTVQTVRKRDVTNLLMTATAEQLDVLKQSLSNFKEQSKLSPRGGQQNEQDDYIEEIFEDEGEEDGTEVNESIVEMSEQEMQQMREEEERKQKLDRIKQMSGVQVPTQKKSARPISATYNLHQFQAQQPAQMGGSQSLRQIDRQQVVAAVQQENQKAIASTKPQGASVQVLDSQHTPQSLANLKQINTNPFKQRPVSHLVPKRATPADQQPPTNATQPLQTLKQPGSTYAHTQPIAPQASPYSKPPPKASVSPRPPLAKSDKLQEVGETQDINELLKKIYKLDDNQRRQLFAILKELETKGDLSGAKLNEGLQKFLNQPQQPTNAVPRMRDNEPVTKQQAQSSGLTQQLKQEQFVRNELVLRVINTLGNPHVCGLTEIELFDSKAAKISLPPACVIIKNHGKGPKVSAEKLINGQKLTINEKQMWLGFLPMPPSYLEIHIYYDKSITLEGLKIWNYNKGILDCTKGVGQLQVLINSQLKWDGKLEPGKGQINQDFSKQIILSSDPKYTLPIEAGTVTPAAETKKLLQDHRQQQPQATQKAQQRAQQPPQANSSGKQPIWFEPSEPSPYESQKSLQQQQQEAQMKNRRNTDVSPRANQVKSDIASAVSSVKKVIENQQQKPVQRGRQQVDESLDSLDFFKVTSMGRLQNKESLLSQTKSKNQFQAEMSQMSSSKKHHQVPQIVKSPFPEDFAFPSPAQSTKKSFNKDTNRSGFGQQQQQLPQNQFDNVQIKAPQAQVQPSMQQKQVNTIPESPAGSVLQFNILTTWGDLNYLGLGGIEVYDMEGQLVNVQKISAMPPDINILPGYGNDPRVVENLIDGHYFTNDEMDVWLTPFTSGEDHTITLDFGKKTQISMIRIWNYNRSRIHAYRGARLITAELDNKLIFRGEIKKAPGNAKDPEACCEILLFTDSDQVLMKIDSNDWLNSHEIAKGMDDTQRIYQDGTEERPLTATKKFSSTEMEDLQFQLQQEQTKPTSLFDERPQTSAFSMQSQRIGDKKPWNDQPPVAQKPQQPQQKKDPIKKGTIRGRKIWINILESWGDLFYVGLNGLEVLNQEGDPIPITVAPDSSISSRTSVTANPRDMNSIAGHGSDHRTLEKLFNDRNNTMDDRNMWLIPFNKGEDHTILIDLGETRAISGLRFYNYNKSTEDSLRGARQIVIKVDDQIMTPKKGVTLRKSPGFVLPELDLGQSVSLPYSQGWSNDQIAPVQKALTLGPKQGLTIFQEYDSITMPVGFLFRFNFYTTHGDLYYMGLNGLQMYDQTGQPLLSDRIKMCASPSDIRHLPGMSNDVRTADKLVNGKNDTADDSNMWLAPFKNTKSNQAANCKPQEASAKRDPNFVCFFFDRPTCVSALQLWNYKKTPNRGVNEFELEVDGCQVYRGFLKQESTSTVVFSLEQRQSDRLCQMINFDPSKRQNVLMINERKVVSQGEQLRAQQQKNQSKFVFDEQARPQTKAINNFM